MQGRPPSNHGESGFTLVELMVVLAIAAILVGFGYTGFSGTLERQRCQAAVKRVNWLLKQAQMQAIEKNTYCAVVTNLGTGPIQVFLDLDRDQLLGANDTLLESVSVGQEYKGVRITSATSGGKFWFNTRGLPRDLSGGKVVPLMGVSIRLAPNDNPSDEGNITISSVGSINVEMPEGWKY